MPQIYDSGLFALSNPPSGAISYKTDTIKALLVTPGYIFVPSHVNVSDINNELTDASYLAAGRQTLANKTQVLDSVNHQVVFSSDPPVYANLANSSTNAAILFKDTGVAGTSQLIAYCNFGVFVATGLDFTILLPSGWFAILNPVGGS